MRPEYDFSKGVRGKYAKRYAEGTNVVLIDPDLVKSFPTSSRSTRRCGRSSPLAVAARARPPSSSARIERGGETGSRAVFGATTESRPTLRRDGSLELARALREVARALGCVRAAARDRDVLRSEWRDGAPKRQGSSCGPASSRGAKGGSARGVRRRGGARFRSDSWSGRWCRARSLASRSGNKGSCRSSRSRSTRSRWCRSSWSCSSGSSRCCSR